MSPVDSVTEGLCIASQMIKCTRKMTHRARRHHQPWSKAKHAGFVRCNSLFSSSSCVLVSLCLVVSIGYQIREGMSLRGAYAHLSEKRPCIGPNAGFMEQLMRW